MRLSALPFLRGPSGTILRRCAAEASGEMISRERDLFDRTPKADRAIIAGIKHVRVIRKGESEMVPVFEVRSLGLGRRDHVSGGRNVG